MAQARSAELITRMWYQNLNHLLSPYDADRSALTDCRKLRGFGLSWTTLILVIADQWAARPFLPAQLASERLASAEGPLRGPYEARFDGLCHPHHTNGVVVSWEVLRA